MKRFEIEYCGEKVLVEAKVESYQVQDFAKKRLRGLCIKLEEISELDGNEIRLPYATITKSFGEFIGIKNAAYVDLNNCPFAERLLDLRLAQETLLSKESGYCRYPLWLFDEDFLKEIGGEKYRTYSKSFDKYVNAIGA